MLFVRTYAQVSLLIAAVLAIYCGAGLYFGHVGSNVELVVTAVSALWLVISFIALFVFPSFKARLWAPLTFAGYCVINLILTFLVGMATKGSHSPDWLLDLRQNSAPLYLGRLVVVAVFALLNILLIVPGKRQTAKPEEACPKP